MNPASQLSGSPSLRDAFLEATDTQKKGATETRREDSYINVEDEDDMDYDCHDVGDDEGELYYV